MNWSFVVVKFSRGAPCAVCISHQWYASHRSQLFNQLCLYYNSFDYVTVVRNLSRRSNWKRTVISLFRTTELVDSTTCWLIKLLKGWDMLSGRTYYRWGNNGSSQSASANSSTFSPREPHSGGFPYAVRFLYLRFFWSIFLRWIFHGTYFPAFLARCCSLINFKCFLRVILLSNANWIENDW